MKYEIKHITYCPKKAWRHCILKGHLAIRRAPISNQTRKARQKGTKYYCSVHKTPKTTPSCDNETPSQPRHSAREPMI